MGILCPILMMIASYLIGSIPFGYLIGKWRGVDIRNKGSHNIGATNALRTLGTKWGFLVYLLDALKGACFVLISTYAFDYRDPFFVLQIHPLVYGMLAILGHLFPVYLKFKGGKGISCLSGVIIAYSWPLALFSFVIFVIVVTTTRYVSLASIITSISLIVGYFILDPLIPGFHDNFFLATLFIANGLVIFKHRSNIVRLVQGNENKISFHKKK